MLTRSPVPASPRSGFPVFHYAPSPSPQPRPSCRGPPTAPTRPSTCSPSDSGASPAFARPRRYVAVDAATQYSPMEPFDYCTGASRVPHPVAHDAGLPLDTAPMPGPQPMALGGEVLSRDPGVLTSTQAIPTNSGATSTTESADPAPPLAPFKRRTSQETDEAVGICSTLPARPVQDPPTQFKRMRPELAPPKTLLPRRYELCAPEAMVVLIAHMLGELIETNDGLALRSGHLTRFHSR